MSAGGAGGTAGAASSSFFFFASASLLNALTIRKSANEMMMKEIMEFGYFVIL